MRLSGGRESLVVQAALYANSAAGSAYLFDPPEEKPFKIIKRGSSVGELRICDVDQDGADEMLWGSSSMIQDAAFVSIEVESGEKKTFEPSSLRRKIDGFGYRVLQPETVSEGRDTRYFVLFGSRILLIPQSMDVRGTEVLTCRYSFNDMWKDPVNGRFIFASVQSGGSCIHVLGAGTPGWKEAYRGLTPPGKIAAILEYTRVAKDQLQGFKRPAWEREPLPVYLMTENTKAVAELEDDLKANHKSPVFLNGVRPGREDWDRSGMANEKYRNRRDRRQQYKLTQQQVLDRIIPEYQGEPGIAYWAGHGNDPYMYNPETTKKVISAAKGRKTVLITPPQHGKFATENPLRGSVTDHLHPLYKDILKEYITDGRHYYSADGAKTYAADAYYRTVEADIKDRARLLPLTVSGDVAWVAAQTSPTHLRLTLIDSGYLNPSEKTATVTFHTTKPAGMTDILSHEAFSPGGSSSVDIDIPCGLFRFIDIELKEAL